MLVANYAKREFNSTNRFNNSIELGQLEKAEEGHDYVETEYRNLYFIRVD